MNELPPEEREGLAEWVALSEQLTRGLIHSLNNRITALGAFAELAAMGDEEFSPDKVLPDELARLQQVNGLFRLLLTEEAGPEPLEVGPIVEDVLLLHAHHPRLRNIRTELSGAGAGGLMPVRVPRWSLFRLLLLVIEAAKQAAEERRLDVAVIALASDDGELVMRARTEAIPLRYAEAMALRCGAVLESLDGMTEVRIPTLLAVRKRERAAREATE